MGFLHICHSHKLIFTWCICYMIFYAHNYVFHMIHLFSRFLQVTHFLMWFCCIIHLFSCAILRHNSLFLMIFFCMNHLFSHVILSYDSITFSREFYSLFLYFHDSLKWLIYFHMHFCTYDLFNFICDFFTHNSFYFHMQFFWMIPFFMSFFKIIHFHKWFLYTRFLWFTRDSFRWFIYFQFFFIWFLYIHL